MLGAARRNVGISKGRKELGYTSEEEKEIERVPVDL